jgi:hypothetical protein
MHIYYIRVLISFVGAAIPAIVAIAKWKKIPPSYYPFIWFIWLTVLGEISATITAQVYKNNAVPSNIYILLAGIFLLLQFNNWSLFKQHKKMFYFLLALFIAVWCWEFLYFTNLWHYSSYYRIIFNFIIVLLSIHTINLIINSTPTKLSKNGVFLICIAFIILYTIKIILEIIFALGSYTNNVFMNHIYDKILYLFIPINILYAIAIKFIPQKSTFTL